MILVILCITLKSELMFVQKYFENERERTTSYGLALNCPTRQSFHTSASVSCHSPLYSVITSNSYSWDLGQQTATFVRL